MQVQGRRHNAGLDRLCGVDRFQCARRAKAISLSFWPPIFGKTNEAKQQFETLIAKQLQTNPSPEHAEAYLWLGNLHLQTGDPDAAKQVWADGLSLFPDNLELAGQLDTSK